MKICIITHSITPGDGQGRVNYEIAQEALRRGHSLVLVSSYIAPDLQGQVEWVPMPVGKLPTAFLRNLVFARQSDRWLHRHHSQYDLVLSNGAITPFPSHINTAHFVHSTWLKSPYHTIRYRRDPYGLYQWLYTALNARWERAAFHQAQTVVAVSRQVKQELEHIDLPPQAIEVILNGVDIDEFQPGHLDRSGIDLPEDGVLALFAGDIRTPRKNLETVLQALVNVPQLHLAIAAGFSNTPYPKLAQSLGLGDRVHFLGSRNDMAQVLQAVDFLVFPSRYETFGLIVLEAMACGRPVITAATTGAAELITPDCGFVLADPNDRDGLAQAMAQLSSNPDLRQSMGKAARAIAETRSWRVVAQQYLDLAEKLYAQGKPPVA